MQYVILITAAFTIIALMFVNAGRQRRKKALEQLRGTWGKQKTGYLNFERIEHFSNLDVEAHFNKPTVQTKADIDFYDLFAFIDRTNSRVGQQCLFNKLSKPTNDISSLEKFNEQAKFFASNIKEKELAQVQLLKLAGDDAYYISTLMSGSLFEKPNWLWLLKLDVICTVLMLVLAPLYHALLVWLMIPLAVNLGLHFWNRNNTFQFIKSFPQLNALINVCKSLGILKLPFYFEAVGQSIVALKSFQAKRRVLSLGQSASGSEAEQVAYYLIDMLKAFFLVEIFTFYSLIKELENKQQHILNIFKYVGEIDAAISVASLRASGMQTCLPEFLPREKALHASRIYHPLIDGCVVNDVTVGAKSVLITGSNMSGKTTFLRTIAINSVLAQSIYTCFAEQFYAPVLKLFTSIRIDDSLLDGKSFYFEEVNIMGSLIKESTSGNQNIFILDEVFKGTNTVERIAAAKAILSWLNKGDNLVFVSTHDIELATLLADEYSLYHFEEAIEENELFFDHKLKSGPLKTRNAIRILEINGYPKEIIEEAKKISRLASR